MRDLPHVPILKNVDRARFEAEVKPVGRPVVLKGVVADWPAVAEGRAGPEALADYLLGFDSGRPVRVSVGEPEMTGRFSYTDDLGALNHRREERPLKWLLDALLDPATTQHLFAGGVPMPQVLPGMAEANPMPLLDAEQERLTSLWIGNRSRTAAHWDLPQNLACVVMGRRRFTLLPIDQIANLYVGPIDFTLDGQATSLVDFTAPDLKAHPRFAEALKHAEVAELEPGDVLYMPSLWWHHVENLSDIGAMVNLWWRDGPAHMSTPLLTMMHALTTVRDLPDDERARWRVLFDHYVFRPDGADPATHIPPPARGVLGEMTPPMLARIRGLLARSLGVRPS